MEGGVKVDNVFLDRENIILKDAPFDAFVQFNFMEHQPNPNIMMKAIYNNLVEDGVGLLTVPSSNHIFDNGAFYELIRDHLIYFSKESLYLFLNKNGFDILEYSILNNDTHSVYIKKKEKISGIKFQNVFETLYSQIISYINCYKNTAIWGASHQGLTIASCYNLSNKINYIIDSAPFKQGKFSMGSNIQIISPEKAYNLDIDSIIIIAPGYSNEIASIITKNMRTNISISTIQYNELKVIR